MLNTINVAASGLAVAREQVENVMNNVANENTPGYKKRVVGVSEASHIDARLTGRGALVGDTTRVTNVYMYDNLTTEKSKNAQYEELSIMLADIESIFYETEDSGFSSDLDRYFQALEDLRANPSNEIYKNNLRNVGTIIVDDLQTLYSDIEGREIVAKNTVYDNVEELNSVLNDIGEVNYQLSIASVKSNDLLDKRDQLEQELTEYVDIDINRTTNYELELGGMTAVRFETNIHSASVVSENVTQKDVYATYSGATYENDLIDISGASTWVNDTSDTITYKLNNELSVTVAHGEVVNGMTVDKDNVVKALVYKINNDPDVTALVTAYNGQYITDANGDKVLTSDTTHPDYDATNPDRYLIIESNVTGDAGKFVGRIVVDDSGTTSEADKNTNASKKGTDDVHLEIFDRELSLKSGKLKPMLENLTTTSNNNLFVKYKEMLDNMANTLSDMSQSYIQNSDDTYVYGTNAVDVHTDHANRVDIGLFSGSTVSTLKFNEGVVSGLTQDKLDYLSTLQWKDDFDFDGTGSNLTSFSKYNQSLRVQIAEDKENVDFKKETQAAVTDSLQNSYDKLIKVDKDEEMMNLIKFQAAYEANAKLITMIDEMLAIILGLRR